MPKFYPKVARTKSTADNNMQNRPKEPISQKVATTSSFVDTPPNYPIKYWKMIGNNPTVEQKSTIYPSTSTFPSQILYPEV